MLVSVNNVLIGDREITDESARSEGGGIEQRQQSAAERLVIRELLRQRAERLEIAADDNLDEAIDTLLDREVATPSPDEDACRRYFDANPERFCSPTTVELRHILLPAAPDDMEAREREAAHAEELLRVLRDHPNRFSELAKVHSACPSREHGGDLGQIGRGQTVPEFEAAVLRLPEGLAQRPVESRYGFHIVEILARAEGEALPFDAVRERIADYLREQSWRRAVAQYIARLAEGAEIQGIELSTDAGLL